MIEIRNLTKRYGGAAAVDNLSFTVKPGRVTGFLGPNGAGKSTTMRVLVGLSRPTSGTATIGGRDYLALPDPMCQVGALLEAPAVHGGRSARNHLLALAQTHGFGRSRVDRVLADVGLAPVANRMTGGFSLGMRQRLGIAAALLGDPAVVILDEPTNGLDPDGVLWLRNLLRGLAADGRTVLISSHLMSEMAVTADQLVIIGKGRLLADASLAELIARVAVDQVLVRSQRANELRDLLVRQGATVTSDEPGQLYVSGLPVDAISLTAAEHRLPVNELTPQRASLEEAYMELTRGSVEFEVGAR